MRWCVVESESEEAKAKAKEKEKEKEVSEGWPRSCDISLCREPKVRSSKGPAMRSIWMSRSPETGHMIQWVIVLEHQ